jgi:hypothetical protein
MINATEARLGTFFGDAKYGSGREERKSSAESREALGYACVSDMAGLTRVNKVLDVDLLTLLGLTIGNSWR